MATKATEREFKSFAFKLDGPPDDEGRFTGYAAVFGNVDLGGDVIEAGAFTKTLQENPAVPILWSHDPNEPLGVSTALAQDSRGLKFEGQLAMDVQRAREIHSLMKLGAVKGVSIGYRTVKRSFKGNVRHLQELALGEFSPCVFPMNPLAEVDDVKSDRKYYGLYSEVTEGVGCLLQMIACGTDFLSGEVTEGDATDVAAMQSILSTLATILTSELAEIGGDTAEADAPMEEMRSHIEASVKSLEALLTTPEPADEATQETKDVASPDVEPVAATLRALIADMGRKPASA